MSEASSADPTLTLAIELIGKRSVTPDDAGCQKVIKKRLSAIGFTCETLRYGEVTNLWARLGDRAPLLCFAGHTDVVPAGKIDSWKSDPFKPDIRNGRLYGRGAADMKGGLAAMITAVEETIGDHMSFAGSIAFLITSDEEGDAINGTRRIIEELRQRHETIDYCIVGEPSSSATPGDTVRVGRRGSLTGTLQIRGKEGHVAYAHLASNPIRGFAPALAELCATTWDDGNEHFPPTTFELTHLVSSSGADNVIPGILDVRFNLRYSTEWTEAGLRERVDEILRRHPLEFELGWHLSGEPFLTETGPLISAAEKAIRDVAGMDTCFSTGGGTSDGRFIAPFGADVVEIGLVNASIHKPNENTEISHLGQLRKIYTRIIELLLRTS